MTKIAADSVNLVLIGKFEPNDFLPESLIAKGVIPKEYKDSITYIALVPGQSVHIKCPLWEMHAQKVRIQITTSEAPHIRIYDLLAKILGETGDNSALYVFGINRETHFDMGSVAARNKIGVRLAPPTAWGKWGEKILATINGPLAETNLQGGVILMQMRLPFNEESIRGWLDISAFPSQTVPNSTGICFRANHHHEFFKESTDGTALERPADVEITDIMLKTLREHFDDSIAYSRTVFEEIVES